MQRVVLAALIAAVVPSVTSASILISEVAWMGSEDNANAEWIELYNNGEEHSLDGWSLSAIDGSPHIELEGTVQAGGYVLLERTSDDTVPGEAALVIYTGSLANAGEELVLKDDTGTVVDRVEGSEEWEIGGNNDTKETLQRSGDPPIGGFITAPPTPGKGGGVATVDDDTESNVSYTTGNILSGSKDDDEALERLEPALTIVVPAERTVLVGVPLTYGAETYQERGKPVSVTNMTWNFGDGTEVQGLRAEHTYRYPGTYVMTVEAKRKNFIRDVSDTASMVVKVVEPNIEITAATAAYIEIQNTSDAALDLSHHVLRIGTREFELPQHTAIVAGGTVRFPSETTGLTRAGSDVVALLHPGGALAVLHIPTRASERVAYTAPVAPPVESAAKADNPMVSLEAVPQARSFAVMGNAVAPVGATPIGANALDTASEVAYQESDLWWWLLALGAAIMIVLVTIVLLRREQPEYIDGFEIESDE